MTRPRLAMIGCGAISEFHAPAFRAAGFDLAAVGSRPGSSRLHPFAERHGIPLVFDSPSQLLDAHEEWDALLVAVPADATLEILGLALETHAPILVEKPVACRSAELLPLINRALPVIVGYNRRFYRTVEEARQEVANAPPVLAHLVLPESIPVPERPSDDPSYLKNFFANSVHGLDLVRHIFGSLKVDHVRRMTNQYGAIYGLAATFYAENGSVIQFTANWQTPANFSLTIDRPGRRLDLRPFEAATWFEGMEVHEPTPESPIRTYTPKVVAKVELDQWDRTYKPGFYAQAQALAALVRHEDPGQAARLEDAHAVLEIAEQLAGEVCG